MVENKESSPNSMEDFFRISVRKYLPGGKDQLDKFAEMLDKKTRTKWGAPQREKVSKLKDMSDLIPPFIKVHYQVVAAGGQIHSVPSVREGVANNVGWEWQMHVQRPGQKDTDDPLLIRCRRGLFRSDCAQLTRPYLWIIDCRRGGGRHGNGHWEDEQFTRILAQLGLWMTNVERWNIIFLLPPAVFATKDLITKLKLQEGCSYRRGCWAFGHTSVDYPLNFTDGGRLEQAVEPIGDIIICLQHPVETSAKSNFVIGRRPLSLLFDDNRGEAQEPSVVDALERSPAELSRLVGSYLPRGWGLVACSISTAIPTILKSDFQGSDIIVIDDCSERVSFLYDELSNNFHGQLLMSNNIGRTNSASGSVDATEDAFPLGENDGDFYTQFHVRLPREYGTDVSTPDSNSLDLQQSSEVGEGENEDEDVEVE